MYVRTIAFKTISLFKNERNREKYETNFRLLEGDSACLPGHMGPYHYSSHYSNTGIILHLMVRLPPFTQEFIKFQVRICYCFHNA